MAISYTTIAQKIVDMLSDGLVDTIVTLEPDVWGMNPSSEVGVALSDEENEEVEIGSSTPYNVNLNVDIMCSEFSPDGVKEASELRDTLVGNVRDILHADRTLEGLVSATQFGRTTFSRARGESGFFCGAILQLKVFLQA